MDDFFAELELEIAKSVKVDEMRKQRDMARKRANTTSLSSASRAAASAEYKELSTILASHEWGAVGTVALFHEQSCDGCGSKHLIFLQFMEEQCMVKKPETRRWVRVMRPVAQELLPRSTLIQPMVTHICSDCCEEHGFSVAEASMLRSVETTTVPSPAYIQGDLNNDDETEAA